MGKLFFESVYKSSLRLAEANPVDKDTQNVPVFEYSSVTELPNELFLEPTFSVLLPSPNKGLLDTLGKQENKVLLKKSTIERMLTNHKEIATVKEHKTILQNAIYEANTVMVCQKEKKPNYISFIKIEDSYYVSVLDFSPDKKYIEVVDWRKIGGAGFLKMLNQASERAGSSS